MRLRTLRANLLGDPLGGGERSTVHGPLEGLEVLRIHPSASQDSLDVGLDGRLQRGEHLLADAPFWGRVTERFRRLRLGHGRSPPTRAIGRSALAQYPDGKIPNFLVVHPHPGAARAYTGRIGYSRGALRMTGAELRALRIRLGLTQADLAEAVGVVGNTLARWERGELAISARAIERLDSVSRSGSSGRAVTRALGVVLDPHHRAILEALNGKLDPAAFEECAADILQRIWLGLVPVRGGQDDGFDGAVADGGRREPFPLVTTTATDLTGNLRRNLLRAQRSNPEVDRALFATSRCVKPRMRNTLRVQAANLGITLVQIADQDWFAQQLYRDPAWSKRLLRVSGKPRALSQFPISRRPVLGDQVLGRESQMRWLLDRRGDCLLVGSPGSGKTFLLRSLVQQGQALFMVGNDPEQVANDLRELQPAAVIIDDAHTDPAHVERFIQLRQEVGSDARIIATSWPSRADDVKSALQIGTNDVRDLDSPEDLIDADTMVEIIKSTGLGGPDELLLCIRQQAPKRPGLVATLAHLCLAGDFRRVVSGEELVDQLAPQLDRMLGFNAQRLLAPFALGGVAGVRPDRVAAVLGKPLFDVTEGLAQLGVAGIVQESPVFIPETADDEKPISRPPAAVSVDPAPMRWVLVQRMFQDVGSLPLDQLLRVVESEEDALQTLIGARSRGASIPRTGGAPGTSRSASQT